MAFKDFPDRQQGIQLLQRSLERGRLGHGYLFTGHNLDELERLARTLAKTLNCLHPVKSGRSAIDCCDQCLLCQKIERGNHADIHWVRPESKSRIITIEQMRELMKEIQLKPTEAEYKITVIVAADRLGAEGANAFLKTLEEPPANSILILLTTEPRRVLETIRSRCLRLNFGGDGFQPVDPGQIEWLAVFSDLAAAQQKSLLGRYRLMDVLLQRLNAMKASIEESVAARSPLQRYKDAEKGLTDKWEAELAAAIEAEYRRQRTDLLSVLQWWLRDIWLQTLASGDGRGETGNKVRKRERGSQDPQGHGDVDRTGIGTRGLLSFPNIAGSRQVAGRISAKEALANLEYLDELQRWLGTNVQEALALEVGLLKLHL